MAQNFRGQLHERFQPKLAKREPLLTEEEKAQLNKLAVLDLQERINPTPGLQLLLKKYLGELTKAVTS